jgi:hypothetical protein
VSFFLSKSGKTSCSLNGVLLHSTYDPEREADRFIEASLGSSGFMPRMIVITEPALSYAAMSISKRLPSCAACAIRYADDFRAEDSKWNHVLYAKNFDDIGEELYSRFGEETLCASLFLSWQASERAFPQETKRVWQGIKNAVSKSRDVLATREYFAARWLKNSLRFCLSLKKTARVISGSQSALIAASGASLEACIPFIQERRDDFFLITVSSAHKTLAFHGIQCDARITTDGGFWAKELLGVKDCPTACAPESSLAAHCFSEETIIPLTYADESIESKLLALLKITALCVKRNGTVAGTALSFAQALTSGPVLFCGLELTQGAGYQHARPHAREERCSSFDSRICPLSFRQAETGINAKGVLAVYKNWFLSRKDNAHRVYRIAPNNAAPLGLIDIGIEEKQKLQSVFKNAGAQKPQLVLSQSGGVKKDAAQKIRDAIKTDIARYSAGEHPLIFCERELFPAKEILSARTQKSIDDQKKHRYVERMEECLAFINRLENANDEAL